MTEPTPPAPYTPAPAGAYAPAAKWNVLAIISLVASILGVGLAGVITGHIALNQIKKTGEQGNVLAIIGLVLGYIGILATIIVTIVVIAGIAAGVSDPGTDIY
ncbi:MAG: DUF4190 domain-containing protein [Rhodoglobus sp.]